MKLFKKKDNLGLYDFLKDIKELMADVQKKQSKNVEISVDEVIEIIETIKNLNTRGEIILIELKDLDIKDKNKKFMELLLEDNMEILRNLNIKVKKYSDELKDYSKLKDVKLK